MRAFMDEFKVVPGRTACGNHHVTRKLPLPGNPGMNGKGSQGAHRKRKLESNLIWHCEPRIREAAGVTVVDIAAALRWVKAAALCERPSASCWKISER